MKKPNKHVLFSIVFLGALAFYFNSSRQEVKIVESASKIETFEEMELAYLSQQDCVDLAAGGPPTISPAIYLDPITGEEVEKNGVQMRGPASDQKLLEYYEDTTSGYNPCR